MSYSENFLFDADVNHFHNLKLNKEIRVFHLGFCLWYIAKRVNSSSMECDTYPDVTIQCHFFGSEGLYFLCSVCPFQVQLHQIFKLSWAREFKSNILCLVSAKYGCTRYFLAIFSCLSFRLWLGRPQSWVFELHNLTPITRVWGEPLFKFIPRPGPQPCPQITWDQITATDRP